MTTPLAGSSALVSVDPAAVRAAGSTLVTVASSMRARVSALPKALTGCRWIGESRNAAQRAAEHKVRDSEEITEVVTQMKTAIDRYAQILEIARDTGVQALAMRSHAVQIRATATPVDRAAAEVSAAMLVAAANTMATGATQVVEGAAIWLASQLDALSARVRHLARTNATDNDRLEARVMSSSAYFGRTAPGARIVYYDDSDAVPLRGLITDSTRIWNDRLRNVKFAPAPPGQRADLRYHREGGNWEPPISPEIYGSYFVRSRTNGSADIIFTQDDVAKWGRRIVAHESGHFFLPDRYDEPCAKLMSGIKEDDPSCTSPLPHRTETERVDREWNRDAPRGVGGLPLTVIEQEKGTFHLEDADLPSNR
ncbi:MAG: snapalysin family zinc-dependent metalloprotease [Nocardioides sp.]